MKYKYETIEKLEPYAPEPVIDSLNGIRITRMGELDRFNEAKRIFSTIAAKIGSEALKTAETFAHDLDKAFYGKQDIV